MAKKKLKEDGLDEGASKFTEDAESELGESDGNLLDEEELEDERPGAESSDSDADY